MHNMQPGLIFVLGLMYLVLSGFALALGSGTGPKKCLSSPSRERDGGEDFTVSEPVRSIFAIQGPADLWRLCRHHFFRNGRLALFPWRSSLARVDVADVSSARRRGSHRSVVWHPAAIIGLPPCARRHDNVSAS
jgi:hypothetical protein